MFAGFWTDWLWYRSVSYSSVFTTTLWTKIGLFLVFGLLMAVVVGVNIWLAYRLRPPLSAMSLEQQSLDRYRMGIAPVQAVGAARDRRAGRADRRRVRRRASGAPGCCGATACRSARRTRSSTWTSSFYAFDLPWYRFLLGFGFAAVVLSLIAAALTHYLYGGLRLQPRASGPRPRPPAHLSVLLGIFVLLKAVAYWLDRYGLAVKSSDFKATDNWTGLRYVDVNAVLPAKTILFCHRADLRRAVLRDAVAAHLAAAR